LSLAPDGGREEKNYSTTLILYGLNVTRRALLEAEDCHEDVWGSGGIASRICNFCTAWRWVVKFTLWSHYFWEKYPRHPLDRRVGGPV